MSKHDYIDNADAERRWPRFLRAVKLAAILSHTEATCVLRDWHNFKSPWGGEAVNHFGGTAAVLRAAIRRRHAVRRADA